MEKLILVLQYSFHPLQILFHGKHLLCLHLIWEMWRYDICYWDIWKTIPLKPISFEVFSYFGWLFLRNFPLIDTNLSMIYFISIFCLFLSESLANLLAIILTLYINALHTSRYLASSYIAVLLLSPHSCCNSLSV